MFTLKILKNGKFPTTGQTTIIFLRIALVSGLCFIIINSISKPYIEILPLVCCFEFLLLHTDIKGISGINFSPIQYFMEGNSGSKSENAAGPSDSSKSSNPTTSSNSSESLSSEESDKLSMDMLAFLGHAAKMTQGMTELKGSKNLKIILDKEGNSSLDVPSSMSEQEGNSLAQRIAIMDRVYNTQIDKYKDLLSKDQRLNEGRCTEDFKHYYEDISDIYKNIF
jgi:hypothetical protein